MDDREAKTYSTPPEAGSTTGETRSAQGRLGEGFPTLMGSVFIGFVVIAVIVLAARYLF